MNKVQVRPDIFVKSASEKMHINYKDKNFILTLPVEKHAVVFDFVELCDGNKTLEEIFSCFSLLDREILEGFHHFLAQHKMVFETQDDLPAGVAGSSLFTYAAQYIESPEVAVKSLWLKPMLIIGSGYSLLSAIKTVAQIGIPHVFITNIDELGGVILSDKTICSVFNSHTCDATQRCTMVPFSEASEYLQAAHVLQVHDKFDANLYQFVKQNSGHAVTQAIGHKGHAVVTQNGIQLSQSKHEPVESKGGLTLLGAMSASIAIDLSLGIRAQQDYLYYKLDMTQSIGSGTHFVAAPLDDIEDGKLDVINNFQQLCDMPLSPIVNFEQLELSQQYLKVYQATIQVSGGAQVMVTGAGFNSKEATQNILEQLAFEYGLWFSNDSNASQMRERKALSQRVHNASLTLPNNSIELPKFSGKASYVHFSLICEFNQAVLAKRSSVSNGEYLFTVSLGRNHVYFNSREEIASESLWERALLALYAQCCAHLQTHSSVIVEVIHDAAA